MQSHLECGTFELVPYDDQYTLIPLQWVYKIKQDKHGVPERAKSRLVARGDRCEQGVHYTDTHAPVVHFTTTRTFLSTCCARGWEVAQMDVGTAFVNADIDNDRTFFSLPDGYKQHAQLNGKRMCLKAKKALYGLPQSPRLWNRKFTAWLATQGFRPTKKDPCY